MTTICLLAHTVALLRARPRDITLDIVAREARVSTPWLSMMLNAKTVAHMDPGVKKVQRLYEYLSKASLLADQSAGK